MADFHLVDLQSQHEAVEALVADWPEAEVLAWLSRRGTVTTKAGSKFYWFISHTGLTATFWFDQGRLLVVTHPL